MSETHVLYNAGPDKPDLPPEPVLMSSYRFADGSLLSIQTYGNPHGNQDDASRAALAIDDLLRLMIEESWPSNRRE